MATKLALRRGKLDLSADQRRHFDVHIVPAWCSASTKRNVRARLESKR